jgi:hypothetical protein
MKKLASVAGVLLFTGLVACADSNLLLRKWKLSAAAGTAAPDSSCLPKLEFTTKTYTNTDTAGKVSTIPVTYVTGSSTTFPTVVYMMTDAGITYHVTFRFLSKDRMILDNAFQCPYISQ